MPLDPSCFRDPTTVRINRNAGPTTVRLTRNGVAFERDERCARPELAEGPAARGIRFDPPIQIPAASLSPIEQPDPAA